MTARKPKLPANRLREWRRAAGLTLEALAEKVGTTNQTLSRYERGERALTIELLMQLAPALGCRPADLLPDPESILDDGERELLAEYKQLTPDDRALVRRMVESLRLAEGAAVLQNTAPARLTRRFN